MNCVTGFLISPRRPPPEAFWPARRHLFSFFPSLFSKWFDRPRNAQANHSPGRCFLGPFMPPGHYLPPPQRLPAASSTIDLLGRRTRRLPLERKGRGRCGLHRTIVGKQLRSYQRFMVVTSIVPMMSCFCCR